MRLTHAWWRALAAVALTTALPTHATPFVAQSLARLDCTRLAADDVRTLAHAPAPRIIALHGSVPFVNMEPFAAFLEAMGYPKERLDQPGGVGRSRSSYVDSRRLAGELAWHYERDGLMPLLVGHSQGGMIVIKVLHDLAGTRDQTPIPVWDALRDAPESRTSIVDPLTGEVRTVAGLRVPYAAVLATGSLPRLLLGQWGILPLLRDVPDAAIELTAFSIPFDPIAGTGSAPAAYRATGTAHVRNVVLPATYGHITLPQVDRLPAQPSVRAWIEAYRPGTPLPQELDGIANLLHAADIWYSIKQHWCQGAKRALLREPPQR